MDIRAARGRINGFITSFLTSRHSSRSKNETESESMSVKVRDLKSSFPWGEDTRIPEKYWLSLGAN